MVLLFQAIQTKCRSLKMSKGSNPKRELEYNHLKDDYKKEHRYSDQRDKVGVKKLNKQRTVAGETKRNKNRY